MLKMQLLCVLLILALSSISTFGQKKVYADLLKDQGYTVMKTPRTKFGTGTLVGKLRGQKDEVIGSLEQCFPGLEKSIEVQKIGLLDRHQDKGLDVGAGGKFIPGGAGVLTSLGAEFKFSKVRNLDVTFGETTAYELTPVALEQYLAGKQIDRACYRRLADKNTRIILSTAQPSEITYKLHGVKGNKVGGDASLWKGILTGNGVVNYSNDVTDTLTIKTPIYVAYKAYSWREMDLDIPNSADAPITLQPGKFKLVLVEDK